MLHVVLETFFTKLLMMNNAKNRQKACVAKIFFCCRNSWKSCSCHHQHISPYIFFFIQFHAPWSKYQAPWSKYKLSSLKISALVSLLGKLNEQSCSSCNSPSYTAVTKQRGWGGGYLVTYIQRLIKYNCIKWQIFHQFYNLIFNIYSSFLQLMLKNFYGSLKFSCEPLVKDLCSTVCSVTQKTFYLLCFLKNNLVPFMFADVYNF